VFAKAYVKLPTLREPCQFRPWVLQIARNAGIDDLRSRRAVNHRPLDDVDPADRAGGPECLSEVRALAAALTRGLIELSARDAAAVSMSVNLGFGPAEIAAALGINEGNAKVVLHRARRRLRSALERQEFLEPIAQAS
jgi:RNA polymerase sigma factor (sigma-70 family)